MNERYREVSRQALASLNGQRGVFDFGSAEITLARLYAYAYRTQTVGAFHATRTALEPFAEESGVLNAQRRLRDLQALAMRPIPSGARAAVPTLACYHAWSDEVANALSGPSIPPGAAAVRDRFAAVIETIRGSNGLVPVRDDELPEQASYKVPGIDVVIVPLVYGDHISWNTAYVTADSRGSTTHRHACQVEIHLGYTGVYGRTLLHGHATTVSEPYAMPIPPMMDHGFDNLSGHSHFVPFVFGSKTLDGWGVFFDVEPRPSPTSDWPETPVDDPAMNGSLLLEPAFRAVRESAVSDRHVLIDAKRTKRPKTGGLELAAYRLGQSETRLEYQDFRILSVREGRLQLSLAGFDVDLGPGDHVGIPAGVSATLRAMDGDGLVMEASLRTD